MHPSAGTPYHSPGIITLLTDFGLEDSYVAEMNAVLVGALPAVTIVDISHLVPPGDVVQARYLLDRTWHRFPQGTVHLAVVDPGVGSVRRAIALSHAGHFFVGPDNGLFTGVLHDAAVVELEVPAEAAPTFHGRDVFAPAAARLVGRESLERLGRPVTDAVLVDAHATVERTSGGLVGAVVHVDRFGNLVTNIPCDAVETGWMVELSSTKVCRVCRTFADVPALETVAYCGSGGTLEIAVRDGSAAERLGVRQGQRVVVVRERGQERARSRE